MSSQQKRSRGRPQKKGGDAAESISKEDLVTWVMTNIPTFTQQEAEEFSAKYDFNSDEVQDAVLNYLDDHRHLESAAWVDIPKKKTKAELDAEAAAAKQAVEKAAENAARGAAVRGGARGGRGGARGGRPASAAPAEGESNHTHQNNHAAARGGARGGRGGARGASAASGRGGRGQGAAREQAAAAAEPAAPAQPSWSSIVLKRQMEAEAAKAKILADQQQAAQQLIAAQQAAQQAAAQAQEAEKAEVARKAEERKARRNNEKQQKSAAAAAAAAAPAPAPAQVELAPAPVVAAPVVVETPAPVAEAPAAAKPAAAKSGASAWAKRPTVAAAAAPAAAPAAVEAPAVMLDVARDPVVIPAQKAAEFDSSVSQLKFGNFAAAAAAGSAQTAPVVAPAQPEVKSEPATLFQPQQAQQQPAKPAFPAATAFPSAQSAYALPQPYVQTMQPAAAQPTATAAAAQQQMPQPSQDQYAAYARQFAMMGMPGPYGMPYMEGVYDQARAMPYYDMYSGAPAGVGAPYGVMPKPQQGQQAVGNKGKFRGDRPQGALGQPSPQGPNKLDGLGAPAAQTPFVPPYVNYGYPYSAYGQYNPNFRYGYQQAPFYPQAGFPAQPTGAGALAPAGTAFAPAEAEHQQQGELDAAAQPTAHDYAAAWQAAHHQQQPAFDASKLQDNKGAQPQQQFGWPNAYYGQQGYDQTQRWGQ